MVWHLDVGLSHPDAEKGFKGLAVRQVKVVHDLSSERRETVWSLSTVGVRKLKGVDLSTRGPGKVNLWCIDCYTRSIVE